MSEQATQRSALEIFEDTLPCTVMTEDERDELLGEFCESFREEQALLLESFGITLEDLMYERSRVSRFLDWLSLPLSGAGFVLVLEHGLVGLLAFLLAGLCLLIAHLRDAQ